MGDSLFDQEDMDFDSGNYQHSALERVKTG
jgi:hypothetical protein